LTKNDNSNLLVKVDHVEEDKLSLKFYLEKKKSQGENRTCKKTKVRFKSRFANTKIQGESRTCKRRITIRNREKNHRLFLQPKVQKILGLLLDLILIYISKCWIKEIQKIKGLNKLYQSLDRFLPISCTLTKDVNLMWEEMN
jgi:hypothetical protein